MTGLTIGAAALDGSDEGDDVNFIINPYRFASGVQATRMFVAGNSNSTVYQYDLSTAWDVTTASSVDSFNISGKESSLTDVFFRDDGTRMFIVGFASDSVHSYDLSTAWDISTASFVNTFSVSSQDGSPRGIFFRPDGTRMFMAGTLSDSVHRYDLSTAWDISTASFVGTLSVSSNSNNPRSVFFRDDGARMFVTGFNAAVDRYDLSTAWDISTASFVNTFSVSSQQAAPTCVFFRPDGTRMFVTGSNTNQAVYRYDLSTAWDVTTASFVNSFSVATQDTTPNGLFLV